MARCDKKDGAAVLRLSCCANSPDRDEVHIFARSFTFEELKSFLLDDVGLDSELPEEESATVFATSFANAVANGNIIRSEQGERLILDMKFDFENLYTHGSVDLLKINGATLPFLVFLDFTAQFIDNAQSTRGKICEDDQEASSSAKRLKVDKIPQKK